MGYTTNFVKNGIDIGQNLVEKSYLIDRYPELADNFKFAGLWLCGFNTYGGLGDNTITNKSSPIQTIASGANWKQVSGGATFIAAIKTDGTLWTWGRNQYGQLGDNTITNKSSPIQTIAGGTNWKLVACGTYIAAAIKTDGTLWTWGQNNYGQLGDNTTVHKSSPIQTIAGGTNWKQVSGGALSNYISAIKTDGTLWLWGYNNGGQLGNNNNSTQYSPVQTIAGGTNWKHVACGSTHTAAIKTDGTLWTWGGNGNGALGDNTIVSKYSPVQTIASGTNWKQVSCGFNYTAAIKTDGSLWMFGYNSFRQLGDNTTTSKSSPVQTIASGTNWKQVSCSQTYTAAIKTNGTLWTWGTNSYGMLGDNTTNSQVSPIQTIAGGTNWKQVACGARMLTAIRDNSEDLL